jgi:hypothetical protein
VEIPDRLAPIGVSKQRLRFGGGFGRHQHLLPAERLLGAVAEHPLGSAAPQHHRLVGIAADDRHMRGVDDGGERVLGLPHLAPGGAHLLAPELERRGHLIEVVRQRPDLVAGAHRGAMAEIAARQHRRIHPEAPQRPHDPSRQQPRDREREGKGSAAHQGAPFQPVRQSRVGDVGRHPDGHHPGHAARHGKAVHALQIVAAAPTRGVAALLGGNPRRQLLPVSAMADPVTAVRRDHEASGIDDAKGRIRRQPVQPQRVLEMVEHRADRQHGPYLPGLILDGARDVDDPVSAADLDRIPDRRHVIRHGLAKIGAVACVGRRVLGAGRCSDRVTVEIEQVKVRIETGKLFLNLSQQRVVGAPVGRIVRYGLDQHRQQVLQRADMVVDLGGENAGLVRGTFSCGSAIALPLTPQSGRHQSRQWNHGRECQPKKP